jgi:hypothetical protein
MLATDEKCPSADLEDQRFHRRHRSGFHRHIRRPEVFGVVRTWRRTEP